jgi:thiol:disulfide interchange protein DsbD
MKPILNLILILLTCLSVQSLHAAESSKGASLFTDGIAEEEFLSPDVAFKLDVVQADANSLRASFKIVPGYYLYKQRISFSWRY